MQSRTLPALAHRREHDDGTILPWHRGHSLSDIAPGHAIWNRAKGQRLRFF